MSDTKLLGRWGEELAAAHLKSRGYKITGVNYRWRMGEIDVIARNRRYLVFCEVKLRRSADFARAGEFVTRAKQERLITTAQIYLTQNPTRLQPRFDVIEIYAPRGMDTENIRINHIENAFACV